MKEGMGKPWGEWVRGPALPLCRTMPASLHFSLACTNQGARSWLSDAGSTAAYNCLLHLCLESGPTQATHNTQQSDSHREEHHVCNRIFPATLAMKRFSRCGVIATLTPNCKSICEL